MSRHPNSDATAQRAIELLASRSYKRYLTVTEAGKIRIDLNAIREAGKYDGKWVLETNDDNITLEDAADGYKGLNGDREMLPVIEADPDQDESHVPLAAPPD